MGSFLLGSARMHQVLDLSVVPWPGGQGCLGFPRVDSRGYFFLWTPSDVVPGGMAREMLILGQQ